MSIKLIIIHYIQWLKLYLNNGELKFNTNELCCKFNKKAKKMVNITKGKICILIITNMTDINQYSNSTCQACVEHLLEK